MRGVVMSVKGRSAVLLNKDGEFVRVRNKNYTVGSTVSVTSNTGRICALAASLLVVCGGIGSYFTPVGYVSVDINPSVLLTLNVYNKVIGVDALNDDGVILLKNADVKGKNAEDSVDILIKSSEEIGYLNENNNDVIVEVVSGIRDVKFAEYSDVEVVVEKAEKSDLRNAKEMGISIAKAKAIKAYTTQNGGTVKDNAEKLVDKSVKEIRKNLENTADELPVTTPAPTVEVKEIKAVKTSSKKDENSILSFIGDSGKKEEEAEENRKETTIEDAPEVKPTISVEEIFRTPAPYFEKEKEKEQDKKADVKEETEKRTKEEITEVIGEPIKEEKPSFSNHFIPPLRGEAVKSDGEAEKQPIPRKENESTDNSGEILTDKEVNVPQKEAVNVPDTEKQENNTAEKTENSVKTQPTDKISPSDNSENNKPEYNESPKSENDENEMTEHNHGSENVGTNKIPPPPSQPDSGNNRDDGGNRDGSDNSPHGETGGNNGFGGFNGFGDFGGER